MFFFSCFLGPQLSPPPNPTPNQGIDIYNYIQLIKRDAHDLFSFLFFLDTQGVTIENTVCYDTNGHMFFLEDGAESSNIFNHNLGVLARPVETNPIIPTGKKKCKHTHTHKLVFFFLKFSPLKLFFRTAVAGIIHHNTHTQKLKKPKKESHPTKNDLKSFSRLRFFFFNFFIFTMNDNTTLEQE